MKFTEIKGYSQKDQEEINDIVNMMFSTEDEKPELHDYHIPKHILTFDEENYKLCVTYSRENGACRSDFHRVDGKYCDIYDTWTTMEICIFLQPIMNTYCNLNIYTMNSIDEDYKQIYGVDYFVKGGHSDKIENWYIKIVD